MTESIQRISLELLLQAWGREYGAGHVQWLGYPRESTLSKAILFGGKLPSRSAPVSVSRDLTDGEVVERIVRRLENQYWREMQVLRIEYCGQRGVKMNDRLDRLKRIGVDVSRRTYYRMAEEARRIVGVEWYDRKKSHANNT